MEATVGMVATRRAAWTTGLLAAVLALVGCSSPGAGLNTSQARDEQLRKLVPGLEVTEVTASAASPGDYDLLRFSYRSILAHWPYGAGIAVLSSKSGQIVWVHLHHGDFPPQSIHWADFDVDGRPDIFYYAGEEDVSTTYLFLNRVTSEGFGLSHFALGYSSDDVYAVVLDMEGDGRPELLIPEPDLSFDAVSDTLCFEEQSMVAREYPEVVTEYHRLAGGFEPFNRSYGSLVIFDKVVVLRFEKHVQQVTDQYPEHLRWRIDLLEKVRATATAGCVGRIDETVAYLRQLLKQP